MQVVAQIREAVGPDFILIYRLSMLDLVEGGSTPEVASLRMEAGGRLPLITTAAGRAYLAATPENERADLIGEIAKKAGDEWPALEASLNESFREYEEFGFCLSLGEWDRNVNAAGVPIRLADGSIMALTCGAPSFQLPIDKLKDSLAHQLAMLARDIESLGV